MTEYLKLKSADNETIEFAYYTKSNPKTFNISVKGDWSSFCTEVPIKDIPKIIEYFNIILQIQKG